MSFLAPNEIAQKAVENGTKKANLPFLSQVLLGFLGGAFIAIGFLLDIRVTAGMPANVWGSFPSFLGAAVFPVGLILIIVGGGELLTGNLMAVAMAWYSRKVSFAQLIGNWISILIFNFIGAVFVAYFFGHVVGLTETAPFLDKTVAIAQAKYSEAWWPTFVSAVGCNWLVCLAVWLAYGANDMIGKIVGIWFPIMTFVAIGFQHVVANMFVIPAAIFAGQATWGDFFTNFFPVLLGNIVGGSIMVGLIYWMTYIRSPKAD
ncbi:formate/nitrite transporter family protein [Pullulanibacillus sp. KACC 23026]|uniref:formate/nitrite transporter family protein n=1 Tax=Pullulanibacillus sp. KACC 23026 TaxID=3028315 RepID=UPI0023AFACC3|nr:formate/nitrite transporter family protein [Pullulanibacillus sp. KACC 23026]WEG12048.1 formate/nitrite transporter family protein [Pullulanibacillus sp. KACC 23026]